MILLFGIIIAVGVLYVADRECYVESGLDETLVDAASDRRRRAHRGDTAFQEMAEAAKVGSASSKFD